MAAPARHWRSYGTDPLPSPAEALQPPLAAFPSWFMRLTCDRCGKDRMRNEAHMPQRRRDIHPRSPRPHAPRRLRRPGRQGGWSCSPASKRQQPAGAEDRAAGKKAAPDGTRPGYDHERLSPYSGTMAGASSRPAQWLQWNWSCTSAPSDSGRAAPSHAALAGNCRLRSPQAPPGQGL